MVFTPTGTTAPLSAELKYVYLHPMYRPRASTGRLTAQGRSLGRLTVPEQATGDMQYLLRLYNSRNRIDETVPSA